MYRFCIATRNALDVRVKEVNGRKMFYLPESSLGEPYIVDWIDNLFYNRSYRFTEDSSQCTNELRDNVSDFSTNLYTLNENVDSVRVPVLFEVSVTSILSGSNIDRTKFTDNSGVMVNFKSLDPLVYLCAFFFIALMMLVIAGRSLIRHHHRLGVLLREAESSTMPLLYMARIERMRNESKLRLIYADIFATFFGSGGSSRYVALLFATLFFYLCTSFSAVYKTSCIEIDNPPIIKSYQQLLADKQSLPYFNDIIRRVSDQFESAPNHSLKGRVWSKLMASKPFPLSALDSHPHIVSRWEDFNATHVREFIKLMNNKRYVYIVSSPTASVLRKGICLGSQDGTSDAKEELLHMVISVDPSETGDVIGWGVVAHLCNDHFINRKLKRIAESHVFDFMKDIYLNKDRFMWLAEIFGVDTEHAKKQWNVCGNSYQISVDEDVGAMTFAYFKPLFTGLVLIYCILIPINCVERWLQPSRRRQRRRIRRNYRYY